MSDQKNTNNLFGPDWMTQFQLWDLPVNSYCQKIENLDAEAEKLKKKKKKKLQEAYPDFFFLVVRKVYQDDGKIWTLR